MKIELGLDEFDLPALNLVKEEKRKMNFSKALEAMKQGGKVRKSDWSRPCCYYFDGNDFKVVLDDGCHYILGALFSREDILADDWEVCE